MIEETWLTVEQIARQMQVTDQTVRRWLKSGELVGTNFGGRTGYRIREADANAFLERRAGPVAA
jgi:excisionase family DNA binding protein